MTSIDPGRLDRLRSEAEIVRGVYRAAADEFTRLSELRERDARELEHLRETAPFHPKAERVTHDRLADMQAGIERQDEALERLAERRNQAGTDYQSLAGLIFRCESFLAAWWRQQAA